jgi:hypothetical protein
MRPDDPSLLSAEQRSQEIARLLANGVRRLFSHPTAIDSGLRTTPEKSPQSAETGLEVDRETRLSVHRS